MNNYYEYDYDELVKICENLENSLTTFLSVTESALDDYADLVINEKIQDDFLEEEFLDEMYLMEGRNIEAMKKMREYRKILIKSCKKCKKLYKGGHYKEALKEISITRNVMGRMEKEINNIYDDSSIWTMVGGSLTSYITSIVRYWYLLIPVVNVPLTILSIPKIVEQYINGGKQVVKDMASNQRNVNTMNYQRNTILAMIKSFNDILSALEAKIKRDIKDMK